MLKFLDEEDNENVKCAHCGASIWAGFHSPVGGKYFCSNCFKQENEERRNIYNLKKMNDKKKIKELEKIIENLKKGLSCIRRL